jgi:hypothetical protein
MTRDINSLLPIELLEMILDPYNEVAHQTERESFNHKRLVCHWWKLMMGPANLSIVTTRREFEIWIAMSLAQKKRIRKLAISINWFDDDDIERTAGAIAECSNLVMLLLDQGDETVEPINRWGNVSAAIHGAGGETRIFRVSRARFRNGCGRLRVSFYIMTYPDLSYDSRLTML